MRHAARPILVLALFACLAASPNSDTAPATQPTEQWEAIATELGADGSLADGVYTVTMRRDDLDVMHEDGSIPAEVLKHEFQFYRCDCGKMSVVGEFTVADYEANDVIDALRVGMIKIASVSPMLMGERPRVLIVRFQGSGGSQHLAKTLREALGWTGEARMAPATRPAE